MSVITIRQTTIKIGSRGEALRVTNTMMDLSETEGGFYPPQKVSPLKKKKLHNMKKEDKKIKYRVRTHLEYGERSKGEINSGEILTIPDESYTIDEILEKFTKGIKLDIMHEGSYSDSDDFDDVDERTYLNDLSDIEDIESSMVARRSRAKAKASKQQQKATEPAEEQPADDSKP